MEELERYFARRARRQIFVLTVRDRSDPARSAQLRFERLAGMPPLYPDLPPRLSLRLVGTGLAGFEDAMARAGWRNGAGHSDERGQTFGWARPPPPDEQPRTLAAIVRVAVEALLDTDDYEMTIEPLRGVSRSEINEAAGYRHLLWTGCFLVAAPGVVVTAMITGSSLAELTLVIGALLAIIAFYPAWIRRFGDALMAFEVGLEESALLERPSGRTLVDLVSLVMAFAGLWLPIAVFVAITSVL